MRILISCLYFGALTGSELYVYELAKELAKEHDVDIVSNLGGDLVEKVEYFGVKCFDIKSPPNYFFGDGETKYIQNGETKITEKGKYYKISNYCNYDLMILNHPDVSKIILNLYNAPAINIIHSEILPKYEYPLEHPNIIGYIAVRHSIKQYLIKQWGIPSEKIEVIFNPIDMDRFNQNDTKSENYILFVGPYDYLRKKTIHHLIDYSKKINKELWLIGRNYPDFKYDWVKTFPPTWNVEKYTKECFEVASIMIGRTALEGNLCGKSAIIYDIDEIGDINKIYNLPYMPTLNLNPENIARRILSFAKNISNNSN